MTNPDEPLPSFLPLLPAPTSSPTHIIGISGPSCSGKTTLSRLLRSLLQVLVANVFILHEDDFYKAENELPYTNGFRDWDCAAAIDVPGLVKALEEVKRRGALPDWLESKEDQNEVPPAAVSAELVEELRGRVRQGLEKRWAQEALSPPTMGLSSTSSTAAAAAVPQAGMTSNASSTTASTAASSPPSEQTICILDGFLLYPPSLSSIHEYLSTSLFLPLTHATMSARRANRKGYVTLEGFWEDPPGYVDRVVWPNFWGEHKWLFERGGEGGQEGLIEVGGDGLVETETGLKIRVMSGEGEMSGVLEWAVGVLLEELWGVGMDGKVQREEEGGKDR